MAGTDLLEFLFREDRLSLPMRRPLLDTATIDCIGVISNRQSESLSHQQPVAQEMMNVLGLTKFGRKNLRFISDHPKPTPVAPTELLVKVSFSDLNPVDHHKLNMKPDDTPTPPHRTPFIDLRRTERR